MGKVATFESGSDGSGRLRVPNPDGQGKKDIVLNDGVETPVNDQEAKVLGKVELGTGGGKVTVGTAKSEGSGEGGDK